MTSIILNDRLFTQKTTEGFVRPDRLVLNSVRAHKKMKQYMDGKIRKVGPRRYEEISYEFNIDVQKNPDNTYTYWSHTKTETVPIEKLTRDAFIEILKKEYALCEDEYTSTPLTITDPIVVLASMSKRG